MNQDFEWNDELVKEFVRNNFNRQEHNYLPFAMRLFKCSKQKPLEYEILKLTYGDEKFAYTDIYHSDVLSGRFKIRAVKRLSDNCIFSIGDELGYREGDYNKEKTIGGFIINENRVFIVDNHSRTCPLELALKAEPKKQPILTTNDGCDVFEGGRFWFITPQLEVGLCSNAKNDVTSAIARFSIEENADNYVFENKPCLSIAEVYAITAKYGLPAVAIEQEITELAKSKNK